MVTILFEGRRFEDYAYLLFGNSKADASRARIHALKATDIHVSEVQQSKTPTLWQSYSKEGKNKVIINLLQNRKTEPVTQPVAPGTGKPAPP